MKLPRKSRRKRSDPMFPPWEMHHYVSLTPDGLYHVQNMLGVMIGQHHVHTEQDYNSWKKGIDKKYIHLEKAEFCPCGLEAGYVKEFDGRVWFNGKPK
jgi:hypothetical protein